MVEKKCGVEAYLLAGALVRVSRLYKHTPVVAFFKVAEGNRHR